MKYFSLNNHKHTSNFENAVLKGIAPDKGLYFPNEVVQLPASFLNNLSSIPRLEMAHEVMKAYVGNEISPAALAGILETTLDFPFPLVDVGEEVKALELFHGPTMAFKDVGARFMAGCLNYFIKKGNTGEVTVLVATSGDTGGAVANGFLGVEGIKVVILYPKGKVSDIQERQLTTLGKNITALEVDGAFDQCQAMVKQAFLDKDIQEKIQLTSANSINVARWLPQMLYYFTAYKEVAYSDKKLAFSVPSGNFGNICAGLLARKMGLPIGHFIAANNSNNVVTRYLNTREYSPGPSLSTISNAMDVGDPSNFVRIQQIFENNYDVLKLNLSSYSFDDHQTRSAMRKVYDKSGYIMDPHGAVGYLGLKKFQKEHPEFLGIFLETAHPVKFLDTVEEALEKKVELPEKIKELLTKEKKSHPVTDYNELKHFLMKE